MNYFEKVIEKYEGLIAAYKQEITELEESLYINQAENKIFNILIDKGYVIDISEKNKLIIEIKKQISKLKNNINLYEEIIKLAEIEAQKEN